MRYITVILLTIYFCLDTFSQPLCRIQRYDENDGLTQWHVTQMTQDRQGLIWLATWNGLCRFDGYQFRGFKAHVGDGNNIATDRIRSVWMAADGNLGCKVDDDVFLFNLKNYRFEAKPQLATRGLNGKAVKQDRPFKYKDAQGVVWTVYHDGRLTYSLSGGKETAYGDRNVLESANFCMPDKQGNLWVVATSGIYRLNFPRHRGTIVRYPQQIETKAFFIDRHRRYWIATKEDNAVKIFNGDNSFAGYLAPNGNIVKTKVRLDAPVYCMKQVGNGDIWIGSKPGGLFRLREMNGGAAYRMERIHGLTCNDVYDIAEDHWGRLWIATLGGGICCVENPTAVQPRIIKPFSGMRYYPRKMAQKVRKLFITKNNVMLAASTDGLLACKLVKGNGVKGMHFRCHTREADRKDALSCSATMNIAQDYRGRIFISTESGGVNMITSSDLLAPKLSFRHFNKESGLSTDVAISVVPFGKRMLAVGSNNIVIFSPDDGSCVTFGKSFFLSECRFSEALPIVLPDGRWGFGMQDGLFTIAPKELRKSSYSPAIALTGLSVQGKEKDCAVNALDTLVLDSHERSLTLSFAALDFTPEADIRYAFALVKDGAEDNVAWNNIGSDHSATLLDLDPGTYRLLVKSTNADGIWTNNMRGITVVVTPTFWETTLAHVLILLFVISFIGGTAYTFIYIRRIKRQRHEVLEAYLSLLNADKEDKRRDSEQPVVPKLSEEDDQMMRRISAFVEENIANADIGVGDMAEAAAVSRSGLQRKMKQIMGVTPIDFLKEARIKHACKLLETTQKNVSEIAFACGYTDPKYFSRCFKASTGKSPTEYRR